jgi:hypothetical protein
VDVVWNSGLMVALAATIGLLATALFRLDAKIDNKIDSLGARLDAKIDGKVDSLAARMDARFDRVDDRLSRVEQRLEEHLRTPH